MLKKINLFLLLIFTNCAFSWKTFVKHKNGNGFFLGEPSKTSNLLSNEELPKEQWFEQILDHFDYKSNETWKQRYYVNDKYYQPGGPIFLMIGGEGEATAKWMVQGAWIKYAKQFNALCFQLEHRFYGKSQPAGDLADLFFLASEQALADLATFIASTNIKYNLSPNVKWIAFGGSYPGSLAAWLREKYPHLVHGAISSSGPLLAVVDFNKYFQVVEDSLATYSDECVDAVHLAFNQFETLLKERIGNKNLNDKFKLCDPIEQSVSNLLDISNLFDNLASIFAGVVQYNKDNSPHATVIIDDICEIMTNSTIGPQVERLAEVNALILKTNKENCLDYKYDKMIEQMKNTSLESEMANGGRQWAYQTCTEFGFYQTASNKSDVFGDHFPVEFFVKQCEDIFSPRFTEKSLNTAVQGTNLFNGGLNGKQTNVLYVHGSIDPWHVLGLTKSNSKQQTTIYIQGTAHCANMYEPMPEDPPQLVEAREKIKSYIADLLKQ